MWPTLAGGRDFICVDKVASFIGAQERFDLWVFRRTEGATTGYFVKRLLGLPGEVVDFRGGDVWIGAPGSEPERLARPPALVEAQRVAVPGVAPSSGKPPWDVADGSLEQDSSGAITIVPVSGRRAKAAFIAGVGEDPRCIRDDHVGGDGRHVRGRNAVSDVRVTMGAVGAGTARFAVVHELAHRDLRRVAAGPEGIVVEARVGGAVTVRAAFPNATCERGLRIETLDGVFRVLLPDGPHWRELFAEPRDTLEGEGGSSLAIEAEGGAVRLASLEVARDVHYVWGSEAPQQPLFIPAGRLFFAGDNPEVSIDSRTPGFGAVPKDALVGLVRAVVWPWPMRVPK